MRPCTLLLLLILSAALHAQNVSGIAISALPGMPFTGQQTIVWTHQVGDKTVTARLSGAVARDSQGRTYREGHRFTVDPVDPRSTLLGITLRDPVGGTTTDCDISAHFCRITASPAATVAKVASGSVQTTREDLGSQVIGGLPVTGTRITKSVEWNAPDDTQSTDKIDVGASTIEAWRSDDLKADLSELRKYPSGEVQDVHLAIISRGEPDPKIFAAPKGFIVRDERAIRRIGGDVSAPVLIYSVPPAFTEEARATKMVGNVLVNLVVDQNGAATGVRVVRGIGKGLDEKAVEAASKYRFKPAMEHGKAVSVELNIEINFQVF